MDAKRDATWKHAPNKYIKIAEEKLIVFRFFFFMADCEEVIGFVVFVDTPNDESILMAIEI